MSAPWRTIAVLSLAAALTHAGGPSRVLGEAFGPDSLGDGTVTRAWRLENGLQVVVRHLPHAGNVAIAVAFPVGADHDPVGKEGAARLLADLYLTGQAGYVPERTRDELGHLRPAGWGLQVSPHLTLVTEVVTRAQFPEVLHQVALRIAGVQVTPELLQRSRETVGQELAELYFTNPASALYYEAHEVARGTQDEVFLRLASGRGIAAVTPAEARQRLARFYGPGRAVLSIAGDVSGLDVRSLVDGFFAPLPRRGEAPAVEPAPLQSRVRAATRETVSRPAGVVGVIAPALEDSLHPAFYLAAVLYGSLAKSTWGFVKPPLGSRFEYVLFDDPSLARFYPEAPANDPTGKGLAATMTQLVADSRQSAASVQMIDELRHSLVWLLGGELQAPLKRRLQKEPNSLATLANTAAVRQLWGGEAFWRGYRERYLGATRAQWQRAMELFGQADRQVVLQYNPRKSAGR